MVNYTSLRALAERLIEQDGRNFTLIRRDQGNPVDPAKPWRESTGAAEVTVVVKGVFVSYEKEDFDGTLVRRGDKRVLVAAKSVEDESASGVNIKIEDYDYFLDGTVRWKIIDSDSIAPGPVNVFYDIQARQ